MRAGVGHEKTPSANEYIDIYAVHPMFRRGWFGNIYPYASTRFRIPDPIYALHPMFRRGWFGNIYPYASTRFRSPDPIYALHPTFRRGWFGNIYPYASTRFGSSVSYIRFHRGFWYCLKIARFFRTLEHLVGIIRRQCLHSYWFGNIYPYTSGLDDTALRGQLQVTRACVTASALWLPAPGADAGASGYQAKCLEAFTA
jgi:hypothetical protein